MTSSPLSLAMALSPTWLRGQAWRRPDSRVEDMFPLDFHRRVAELAERAQLDFLFVADAVQLDPSVIATSPGFSTVDSYTVVAALAGVTSRIGLVPTVHSAYDLPYLVARRLQSLHRLTGGRAGWNVVTALGGHRNFGLETLPDSPERYARAAGSSRQLHWTVTGTPDDAVAAIVQWHEEEAIAGLIALPGGSWGSLELFCTEVVPALIRRGLFLPDPEAVMLRARLGLA